MEKSTHQAMQPQKLQQSSERIVSPTSGSGNKVSFSLKEPEPEKVARLVHQQHSTTLPPSSHYHTNKYHPRVMNENQSPPPMETGRQSTSWGPTSSCPPPSSTQQTHMSTHHVHNNNGGTHTPHASMNQPMYDQPMPPPSYHRHGPPGQFIFQAGPPPSHYHNQHQQQPQTVHQYGPPQYQRHMSSHGPPHYHAHDPHMHHQQHHHPLYTYSQVMPPHHQHQHRRPRSMSIHQPTSSHQQVPPHSSHQSMPSNNMPPKTPAKKDNVVQVTPSTIIKKNVLLHKHVSSHGTHDGGSSSLSADIPKTTYDGMNASSTVKAENGDIDDTPTVNRRSRSYSVYADVYSKNYVQEKSYTSPPSSTCESSVNMSNMPNTSADAGYASTLLDTKERRERGQLSPVDAIFAAADVIAKRHSSPPTTTFSPTIIHHGSVETTSATSSVSPPIYTVVGTSTKAATTPTPKRPIKKRKVQKTPGKKTPSPPTKKVKRTKSITSPTTATTSSTTPEGPRSALSPEQDQFLTSRAQFLSQTIESEPGLYRAILLHMALERETPRKPGGGAPDHKNANKSSPSVSSDEISIGKCRGNQYIEGVSSEVGEDDTTKKFIISGGFFWKDFPELESVLQRNMEEYYEMSENRPQSKKQQEFNNRLAGIVHTTALQCGYTFDPVSFSTKSTSKKTKPTKTSARKLPTKANKSSDGGGDDDEFNFKKLRDRIRCYYKTHVQNSKKRLITLLKNPTRPKNRGVLIKVMEEVKGRAARGDGVKLSPEGRAALKRLESKERSMYPHLGLVTPPSQQNGNVVSGGGVSETLLQSSNSSSSSDGWNQKADWHAPPSPRRVSVDPRTYNPRTESSEALQFIASPCKPEHVAILASIREVPVVQFTS